MSGQFELAPGKLAHPSGALWLPGERVVFVADAHLGYGWAQRRRGELGPVLDGGAGQRLRALAEELKPKSLIFLGDVVHAPSPSPPERAAVEEILKALAGQVEVAVVEGNHDRGFARDFGHLRLQLIEEWRQTGVVAIHGDRLRAPVPRGHILVLGHMHPSALIHDAAGAGRRLPAFLRSRRAIVLPAFSPFAGGIEVSRGIPSELREFLGRGPVQVAVTTGRRVVPLKLLGGE